MDRGSKAGVLIGGLVAVMTAGCASSTVRAHNPAATSTAAPSTHAVATVAATPVPVVDTLLLADAPDRGEVTITLMHEDGTTVGTAQVPADNEWSVSEGLGGAYWVALGELHHLDLQGRDTILAPVRADQMGHLAISPDGRSWIYATHTERPDLSGVNRLWRGGVGETERLLAERRYDPQHPVPGIPRTWVYALRSWTPAGVVAMRQPSGGCGCTAFDMETVSGSSLLVDPDTGVGIPLPTDQSCPFSGASMDATVACFHSKTGRGPADELRILRRDGSTQRFTFSGTTAGGDAHFDAAGAMLAYATTPQHDVDNCDNWPAHTTLRVLDIGTGDAHAAGRVGLQPRAWLSDGRILGTLSSEAGPTTVVTVDVADGTMHSLTSSPGEYVVGLVS